jgi:excisionase family DNA binding protein
MNNTAVAIMGERACHFARMLVEARTSARLSQAELARWMSVPTRLVEQWESGDTAPSLEMVKELAAVMGTSIRVSLAPRATSESDGTPPCDPCIMTVDEIAALLRLNRKTVYELARQGKIPVRRIGRSLRASRESLLRWLAEEPAPRDGRRTRSARSRSVTAPTAWSASRS